MKLTSAYKASLPDSFICWNLESRFFCVSLMLIYKLKKYNKDTFFRTNENCFEMQL
jgi:hypothetical protein